MQWVVFFDVLEHKAYAISYANGCNSHFVVVGKQETREQKNNSTPRAPKSGIENGKYAQIWLKNIISIPITRQVSNASILGDALTLSIILLFPSDFSQ